MNQLMQAFAALDARDRLLVVLILASVLFALFSLSFAAAALLLRWRNLQKARRWSALEQEWEMRLLDLVSGDLAPDALRSHISDNDAMYFVDYLTRFAQRMRGAERRLVEEVATPYLPRIALQLRSRRAGTRARAIRTLSLLGLNEYGSLIIPALDDPSPIVAMTAARELCRRENPHFAPAVLTKLDRFQEWSRAYLSAMLAGIGPGAATFLRGTLANTRESAIVRAVAADALRTLNDIPSADIAAKLLGRVTHRDLVAAALRLVGQCGDARHTAAVRTLVRDPDELIRAQALSALATLGTREDLPSLQAALNDQSIWVASHAARALLANAGRAALDSLAASNHPRAELARAVLIEAE